MSEITIELKKYALWPDIKKMKNKTYSNYDYITLCFEIAFNEENTSKNKKAYITGYLMVDHHEDKTNINFQYLPTEETGYYYFSKLEHSKKSVNKKIEFQREQVSLKNLPFEININQINQFSKLMDVFFEETIKPDILNIEPFLKANNIGYEQKELDIFIEKFSMDAKNFFTFEYLSKDFKNEIKQVEAGLMFNSLETNMSEKKPIKKLKL